MDGYGDTGKHLKTVIKSEKAMTVVPATLAVAKSGMENTARSAETGDAPEDKTEEGREGR